MLRDALERGALSAAIAKTSDYEVVIVGGGPVGLCLAMLLGDRGTRVCVIEAAQDIEEDLRASTFHPPTLDMLEPFGITDQMIATGLICNDWQIRLHPTGERAVFDLSVLSADSRHPYRLQCEQWKLSRLLRAKVQASPSVDLRAGQSVEALAMDEAGVTITIATQNGPETLRALFVAGCDGARSIVRKSVGIPFEGMTYPETTLLVTTQFPFEDHLEGLSNVSYCWKEGGNFSLLKVPGRWRVSIYPDEKLTIEEQMEPAALEASLQEIIARDESYDIRESRPYRVHMRIAPHYREGRVFLAGDAAHLNSPAGGMGLNGGLHDAFELAAALNAVLRDAAPDSRLDLYDARRRPIARDEILAQADRNRNRMRERARDKRLEMLADLQAITGDRTKLRDYLLRSSMITGLQRAAGVH
jgi:2-polyprenyl-6-methoxyphenol hydroxylase-like FAD-dependent oxidoreductase